MLRLFLLFVADSRTQNQNPAAGSSPVSRTVCALASLVKLVTLKWRSRTPTARPKPSTNPGVRRSGDPGRSPSRSPPGRPGGARGSGKVRRDRLSSSSRSSSRGRGGRSPRWASWRRWGTPPGTDVSAGGQKQLKQAHTVAPCWPGGGNDSTLCWVYVETF